MGRFQSQDVTPPPPTIIRSYTMPILSKKQKAKAEAKRAANPPPPPPPQPEPEIVAVVEEKNCDASENCFCCHGYVGPAEAPEQLAERLARWAADGRDASGVLVNAEPERPSTPEPLPTWEAGLWLMQQRPHTAAECQTIVELWGPELGADLILYDNGGVSFDDLFGVEMQKAHEEWCSAARAVEHITRAAEQARIAARWQQCVVEQAVVEARRNLKRGQVVEKNGRVCTRCFGCEGDKHTDWEDGGKKARPSTLAVSSECFTHREFLAGRIRDDCPFLHHGDAGWHPEWDRNFLWDPMHPQVMPVAKHIRERGGARLCISEKSAGYLPVHLGGKADGMDARQWRQQAPPAAAARGGAARGGGAGSETWARGGGAGSARW